MQGIVFDNVLKETEGYLRLYSEILILKSIYGEPITRGLL